MNSDTEAPSETAGTVELAAYEHNPGVPITLFGTSDPRVALERMAEIATALVDVIDTKQLYALIAGKKHITVEGWTTLGGMLGVVPVVTGTRPNDTGDGIVATAEARTLDGRVVGAAEGECSRVEARWKSRDAFMLRGMAQTRAISRALRAPLGQIIVLAGYEATPAEEMPADDAAPLPSPTTIPPEIQPTVEQKEQIKALVKRLHGTRPDVDWAERCREIVGAPWNMTTATMVGMLIEKLQAELEAVAGEAG